MTSQNTSVPVQKIGIRPPFYFSGSENCRIFFTFWEITIKLLLREMLFAYVLRALCPFAGGCYPLASGRHPLLFGIFNPKGNRGKCLWTLF
jgi:hypothetical protein